jgi:hypothetical protein
MDRYDFNFNTDFVSLSKKNSIQILKKKKFELSWIPFKVLIQNIDRNSYWIFVFQSLDFLEFLKRIQTRLKTQKLLHYYQGIVV